MALTLLLDLDDTLLGNNMDSFVQPYLRGLSTRLAPYANPVLAARQLLKAIQMMMLNQRPDCTLEQVFDQNFYPALGITRVDVQHALDAFYAEDFPALSSVTTRFPEAHRLVQEAEARGYRMGVATAPLFPMVATRQRLAWAGFEEGNHPFELVSSYETFHFTKPNPAYFAEFLGRMGWPDGPVVMIGNDISDDITGARRLGLPVFWISHGRELPAGMDRLPGGGMLPHGNLGDFFGWLDVAPETELLPALDHPDGMLAILRSTPAVMAGLVHDISSERLRTRSLTDEWTPTEVLCHLRDVDGEVNLPRFELIREQPNPFIAGRNTDEWAESRHYIHQDVLQALADFTAYRIRLLSMLDALSPSDWDLPVRHAIFGPTRLSEMVRFIADHDRLHIRQVHTAIHSASSA